MKKEDREFLIKLQHEMLTQDTVGQADPRFWVVMQEVKEYRVEDDEDGVQIYDTDSCEIACDGDLKDIYDWIEEQEFDLLKCDYNDVFGQIEIQLDNEEEYVIEDADDLIKFLEELGFSNYEIVKYRVREEIAQNTMFLTLDECKNHIKANGYHYTKPHPYAMTAWRSPQVARLYKILQETKWDESEVEQ
ncbi:Uncharacterised protein [Clostridium carnis]|uniref:Phage protein n=1 Tax=Clostridium carnis TaxID=1530 RepID=A0ABY6SXZ2_9CLOT|nr:hypothetical protein [Clostridium carnis]VDG73425.1 Uncharacterised protein [Clostridium carnis]